ncbi:hypothetical protein ABZ646_46355 [Streptomyces sp. NPDC007162]|uniref:hypothetical protein n=1 Tax=Streptomyces sp. NPDC007162 TaxID=3156917 RepID=UPI00340C714A
MSEPWSAAYAVRPSALTTTSPGFFPTAMSVVVPVARSIELTDAPLKSAVRARKCPEP